MYRKLLMLSALFAMMFRSLIWAETITLENNLIKKVLVSSSEFPDQIRVTSIFSKEKNSELLAQSDLKPYFEIIIHNKLITANDRIWQFKKQTIRKLENGGQEFILIFEGKKKPVDGLVVIIYQQIFTDMTFIREKLELQAPSNRTFRLDKLNYKLHFKFPQYSLKNSASGKVTEIRLATWANELIPIDNNATYDERFFKNADDAHNLANCYMFHPQIKEYPLAENTPLTTKGPINIVRLNGFGWISIYEHASQDNLKGMIKEAKRDESNLLRDGLQGIAGTFNFKMSDSDLHFLGISQVWDKNNINISIDILRGGYLAGEVIDKNHPYSSVWSASGFYPGLELENGTEILRDYLWRCICEKPASRQPEFYYNTWGMQRKLSSQGQDIRGILTQEKILQEIEYAAGLGIDIFVLDDGWQQAHGIWTPHPERLPNGLKPIKEALDHHGIKLGVWFSPLGIDSTTQRYKEHPEWVIWDSEGKPILGQWNHPTFDLVSDFYDLFIEDCKKLIDQGVRFFKWDAINSFYSSRANLHHGSDKYSAEEIRARYEYLLPIYVARAMKELTDYEPELIIEIDLTEARRMMTGLAVLSAGKYFWMNNGASAYNDYSAYRAKSMRTIPNQFADIIPISLFTFANYPHDDLKNQRYNVNTSLIAGHGFWGALQFMSQPERLRVGKLVSKSKKVLPYITNITPQIIGRVGASPEIYTQVNHQEAAGQVIAFSGQALNYKHRIAINKNNLLAVLNHSYRLNGDSLLFEFNFPMPDATREAFILPDNGAGISIVSSTCWLDEVELISPTKIVYIAGAPGRQVILWKKVLGKPQIVGSSDINYEIEEDAEENCYRVNISIPEANTRVTIGK